MRSSERLLHTVLQSRELSHRIVTAEQEEKERDELRRVHPVCDDLALSEEQQQHDKQNSDHLDRRR